jgi:hypothetical protein
MEGTFAVPGQCKGLMTFAARWRRSTLLPPLAAAASRPPHGRMP